jgi:hypothetical protein
MPEADVIDITSRLPARRQRASGIIPADAELLAKHLPSPAATIAAMLAAVTVAEQ